MLTLTYGLGQLRAALAWSETALATLNAAEGVASPNPHSPTEQSQQPEARDQIAENHPSGAKAHHL